MREVETWRVEEDRREKGNWLVEELVKVTVAGHLAVNSRVTVGAQSGHSRVTVGSYVLKHFAHNGAGAGVSL